jgi:lysozyme family protein
VLDGYTTPAGVNDRAAVTAYQQKLKNAGYDIKVDGVWGPQTDAANSAYAQKEQQINYIQNLLSQAQSSASRVGASYDAAGRQYTASQDAALASTKASLQNQKEQLGDQYNAVRSQAYVNARLQSIGNNEKLAAQGLAGNMYDDARSGVSETSRITENTAMRNDINTATKQEQAAKDEIAQAIIQAQFTRDQNVANQLASLAVQKASARASAESNAAQQILQLLQYQDSITPTTTTTSKKGNGGGGGSMAAGEKLAASLVSSSKGSISGALAALRRGGASSGNYSSKDITTAEAILRGKLKK